MCSDWFGSSPRVRGKPTSTASLRPRGRLIPACAGKTSPPWPPPPSSWAHPRVCGENGLQLQNLPRAGGSSPRVRGKPLKYGRETTIGRLIPACAGKTSDAKFIAPVTAAHPRVCGENSTASPPAPAPRGSSPRVRGKHAPAPVRDRGQWLIPACAGKTVAENAFDGARAAHPRVCGENVSDDIRFNPGFGSSPRVRGKPADVKGLRGHPRLIPACAGKTCPTARTDSGSSAHPRVCGENLAKPKTSQRVRGSSPRVRGKHRARPLRLRGPGLIPACAGKTIVSRGGAGSHRAHPRVCGENARHKPPKQSATGSSPRVRGKHPVGSGGGLRGRLIPACAGKTRDRSCCSPGKSAHPRVCGENKLRNYPELHAQGSSPRVRGKHAQVGAGHEGGVAHPRVCGENPLGAGVAAAHVGSSPRVRGKLR